MLDPHAHKRFRHIRTRATLPDGRVRTASHSFPRGADKATYDAIDAALVRAYGSQNCRTEGEPMVVAGGLEAACRAVAIDHYSRRFRKPPDDPHVVMNAEGNWQVFAHDAEIAIAAYLGHQLG